MKGYLHNQKQGCGMEGIPFLPGGGSAGRGQVEPALPPHPPPTRVPQRRAQRDLKGTFLSPKRGEIRTVKERSELGCRRLGGYFYPVISTLKCQAWNCLSPAPQPPQPFSMATQPGNRPHSPSLVPLLFQESHSAMETGGMETPK